MNRILLSLAALALAVPAFAVDLADLRVGTPYSDLPREVGQKFVKMADATYVGQASAGGRQFLVAFDVNDTGELRRVLAYRLVVPGWLFEQLEPSLLGPQRTHDTATGYFPGELTLTRTCVVRDIEAPTRKLRGFMLGQDVMAYAEYSEGDFVEKLQSQVLGVPVDATPQVVAAALAKGGLAVPVPREKEPAIVTRLSDRAPGRQ